MADITLAQKFQYQINVLKRDGRRPECGDPVYVNSTSVLPRNNKGNEYMPMVEVGRERECQERDGKGYIEHDCGCEFCIETGEDCPNSGCHDGLTDGCGWSLEADIQTVAEVCIPEPKLDVSKLGILPLQEQTEARA